MSKKSPYPKECPLVELIRDMVWNINLKAGTLFEIVEVDFPGAFRLVSGEDTYKPHTIYSLNSLYLSEFRAVNDAAREMLALAPKGYYSED